MGVDVVVVCVGCGCVYLVGCFEEELCCVDGVVVYVYDVFVGEVGVDVDVVGFVG